MEEKIFYITKEKLAELQKEHADLTAEHAALAGQETPRMFESEELNSEFVSYQERVDGITNRLEELENILAHYSLIKKPPIDKQHVVDLGACVHVDINGKKNEFVIMGTLEANPIAGKISNESPVGKALLGRKIGEEFELGHPDKKTYKIKNITYQLS